MKEISIENLNSSNVQQPSREPLKPVLGGAVPATGADCVYATLCTIHCSRGGYCNA